PAAWHGQARLSCPALDVRGERVGDFSAGLLVQNGEASLSGLRGHILGGELTGSATLSLSDRQRYQANLSLRGVDLALVRPVAGRAEVSVELGGELTDAKTLTGTGSLRAAGLRVGEVRIDELTGSLGLQCSRLTLHDVHSRLYKGEVTGTAALVL